MKLYNQRSYVAHFWVVKCLCFLFRTKSIGLLFNCFVLCSYNMSDCLFYCCNFRLTTRSTRHLWPPTRIQCSVKLWTNLQQTSSDYIVAWKQKSFHSFWIKKQINDSTIINIHIVQLTLNMTEYSINHHNNQGNVAMIWIHNIFKLCN